MLDFVSYASSSRGNTYTLSGGKTTVMLDCGIPWRQVQRKMNFKTSSLSGICTSHSHNDHCAGLKDAIKAGIDVFTLPETKEALGLSGHRVHEIELLKNFTIGTFSIKAFPLKHDVPNCGFLIMNKLGEKMVYITDTAYCEFKFPPLQIIAIECNYQEEILNQNILDGKVPYVMKKRLLHSHLSLKNACEFLRANDLSQLRECYLLHLSDGNSNAEEVKKTVQGIVGVPVYIADAYPKPASELTPPPMPGIYFKK